MDSQTLAVVVTFTVNLGIFITILIGFLIYRKCRGDNIIKRSSNKE